MTCACLQRLAVLHHCLDCIGIQCASKSFVGCLHSDNYGHSHVISCKLSIKINHLHSAVFRLFRRCVSAVPFLPKEFSGTQEHTCAHLPAHHIRPLVTQQREITIAVNPVLVCSPDYCFRCRANYKFLFKACGRIDNDTITVRIVLESIMCHNSTFLGKALYMLCLSAQKRFRDKQWEISVLHTSLLEHPVKLLLHFLPNGVSVWFDYHTSPYCRLLGKIGFYHQFVIPL